MLIIENKSLLLNFNHVNNYDMRIGYLTQRTKGLILGSDCQLHI